MDTSNKILQADQVSLLSAIIQDEKIATHNYVFRKIRKTLKDDNPINMMPTSDTLDTQDLSPISLPVVIYDSPKKATLLPERSKVKNLYLMHHDQKENIDCRQLGIGYAEGRFGRGKNKFDSLMTEESKPVECGLLSHEEINKKYLYQRIAKEALYFQLSHFNAVLQQAAQPLWDNTVKEKIYRFYTSSHLMVLRLVKEDDVLKIYFYDPNCTLMHRRLIISHPNHLKQIEWANQTGKIDIDRFLDESLIKKYFPEGIESGCLLSMDTESDRDQCKVNLFGEADNGVLSLMLAYGHLGHKVIHSQTHSELVQHNKELPELKVKDGTSALFLASTHGYHQAVSTYTGWLTESQTSVSPTLRAQYLMGTDCYGKPALFTALKRNNADVVRELTLAILNGNFPPKELKDLLIATREDVKLPALIMACQKNSLEAIKTFVDTCMSHGVERSLLVELFTVQCDRSLTLLTEAVRYNMTDLISCLFETLEKDKELLKEVFKKILFLQSNDMSCLFFVLENKHCKGALVLLQNIFLHHQTLGEQLVKDFLLMKSQGQTFWDMAARDDNLSFFLDKVVELIRESGLAGSVKGELIEHINGPLYQPTPD